VLGVPVPAAASWQEHVATCSSACSASPQNARHRYSSANVARVVDEVRVRRGLRHDATANASLAAGKSRD